MRRALTNEEHALWAKVAATAKPLRGKTQPEPQKSATPAQPALRDAHKPKKKATAPTVLKSPPQITPQAPAERSADKRVRRGRVDIEGKIDLHGMTQMQARGALRGYLFNARERGGRCVLVVTGKGDPEQRRYGHETPGILRRMLPEWLAEADLRAVVAGYAPAHARHGGAGAWYVFLKRRS